jgi:hypothetical protein
VWSCYGLGGELEFVFDGGEHAERGVPAAAVAEDLQVLEQGVGELKAGAPALPVEQLGLHPAQNDSIIALSQQSPIDPLDGSKPDARARSVRAQEVNCTRGRSGSRCPAGRRGCGWPCPGRW